MHDPKALGNDILHKYFRHSKYSSFQRQLNYFGFRKVRALSWAFRICDSCMPSKHSQAAPHTTTDRTPTNQQTQGKGKMSACTYTNFDLTNANLKALLKIKRKTNTSSRHGIDDLYDSKGASSD